MLHKQVKYHNNLTKWFSQLVAFVISGYFLDLNITLF